VDNIIANISVAILEASRRTLKTNCVKISVPANVKNV